MKVLNAFSLNMIRDFPVDVCVEKVADLSGLKNLESAIGHADTAVIFSQVLGVDLPMNRTSVVLDRGETVLVGQYVGPRLPEGVKTLPVGAVINWFFVTLK